MGKVTLDAPTWARYYGQDIWFGVWADINVSKEIYRFRFCDSGDWFWFGETPVTQRFYAKVMDQIGGTKVLTEADFTVHYNNGSDKLVLDLSAQEKDAFISELNSLRRADFQEATPADWLRVKDGYLKLFGKELGVEEALRALEEKYNLLVDGEVGFRLMIPYSRHL